MKVIKRVFGFDAGHRVLNHPGKCKDFHGHRYFGEVGLFYQEVEEIGYAIDFGDIKKLALGCFDHFFDHGMILNGTDRAKTYLDEEGKVYVMSYHEDDVFRNPTAENIAEEMLCMMDVLFEDIDGLSPSFIELYETPNCSVVVGWDDVDLNVRSGFEYHKGNDIRIWKEQNI